MRAVVARYQILLPPRAARACARLRHEGYRSSPRYELLLSIHADIARYY